MTAYGPSQNLSHSPTRNSAKAQRKKQLAAVRARRRERYKHFLTKLRLVRKQHFCYDYFASMADNDQLLKHIGKLIEPLNKRLDDQRAELKSLHKRLDEQGKDIKTIKADVAVVKDVTAHTETAVKALDAKVDATKAQLEREIKQQPQKAD